MESGEGGDEGRLRKGIQQTSEPILQPEWRRPRPIASASSSPRNPNQQPSSTTISSEADEVLLQPEWRRSNSRPTSFAYPWNQNYKQRTRPSNLLPNQPTPPPPPGIQYSRFTRSFKFLFIIIHLGSSILNKSLVPIFLITLLCLPKQIKRFL